MLHRDCLPLITCCTSLKCFQFSYPRQLIQFIVETRSLLNTNSRENSEMTIETTVMITEATSNQMSRKLNEIKSSINSQIQDAISTAISEKKLAGTSMQGRHNFTVEDRRSSGLQRNPEPAVNCQKAWENYPKSGFTGENQRQVSRQSSVDSYTSEQNRDISYDRLSKFS